MDRRAELLERVRFKNYKSIMRIAQGGSNVSADKYLDTTSLTALCNSFDLEPDHWQADDLERILIVREGLYEVRNKLPTWVTMQSILLIMCCPEWIGYTLTLNERLGS